MQYLVCLVVRCHTTVRLDAEAVSPEQIVERASAPVDFSRLAKEGALQYDEGGVEVACVEHGGEAEGLSEPCILERSESGRLQLEDVLRSREALRTESLALVREMAGLVRGPDGALSIPGPLLARIQRVARDSEAVGAMEAVTE